MIISSSLVIGGLVVASAIKPLPSYLVASSTIPTGTLVSDAEMVTAEIDLGTLSDAYVTASTPIEGLSVTAVIGKGELIPLRLIGKGLRPDQTAIRFVPNLKPAESIVAGSVVSVWQVTETEDGFVPQRIVSVSEVLAIEFGDGLFAEDAPDVELLLNLDQSTLVLAAVAAGYPIYVLPLP
ncbi:MAG: SAF domain-containing protein [Candidatus Aquiluna sp.]|nr:SAF domain-containing protein [Aquiluna sp.]